MHKTLISIRIFFILFCLFGGVIYYYSSPNAAGTSLSNALILSILLGSLLILIDIFLKGFSLRGLTALTFGLAIGALISFLIGKSPMVETALELYPQNIFLIRSGIFVACMYLATTIALRGKDEFNLVIPYMRFVPHGVRSPLAILDSSALIDGRIEKICQANWMSFALVVPRFVIQELRQIADSNDIHRQQNGREGLATLHRLQELKNLDLRIDESSIDQASDIDSKIVFLASSLKASIITTDYNLAQEAKTNGIAWLNLSDLYNAVKRDAFEGQQLTVKLIKEGKDKGQAVGFLEDGSMIVVRNAQKLIGQTVPAVIDTIIPTSNGKMIFADLIDKKS